MSLNRFGVFSEITRIREAHLGKLHISRADSYVNIGLVFRSEAESKTVLEYFLNVSKSEKFFWDDKISLLIIHLIILILWMSQKFNIPIIGLLFFLSKRRRLKFKQSCFL